MSLRIELERHGSVACVRLASPERGNAFGPPDFARLAAMFEQAWADTGTRALVLTGSGKQFSAGADMGDLGAVGDADMAELVAAQTERIASAFAMSPIPTVVAVNGSVAGAACSLVLMADVAVASDNARFLFPFAKLGLVADTGLNRLLAQQIGAARARRILFESGSVTAVEALEWGILRSLHSPDSLHAEAVACATRLGAMPSGVHAAMRALLSDAASSSAGLRDEAAAQSARLRHPETIAAISAAAQAMANRRH
jgi:2-(1,2-epoxy-1,2-dihydrophenyl)acetyl-CoA isomerase